MDEQSSKAVKDLAKLIAAAAIATVWLPAYPLGDKRPEEQQAPKVEKPQQ
ncbi:MAG TPA: hypothetical protein VF110_05430 [Burkholderiales bacterium]|jgi:hypothetical protein